VTVRVRPARPDDTAFIDALGLATALDTVSPVRAMTEKTAEASLRRLTAFCRERSGTVTLVAEQDGERAGFCILLTDVPDDITQQPQAFIAYLAVRAQDRGRGAGRALLREAIAEGERRGLPHISLMVSAQNDAARALYESEHFMPERVLMNRPLRPVS
jgi:ribosomal protein S18 acetylase RimI-like enzyme